jgi:HNH endonuclease
MRSRRSERERRLPFWLRLLWWLLKLTLCLPVWLLALLGSVLWLIAWPLRRRRIGAPIEWPAADEFYRSYGWRSLRIDALEANRERHGALRCDCCLAATTGQWHVDHILPRSSHPELALEPANLQVLCEDCNLGKGTRYATDWRYEEPA